MGDGLLMSTGISSIWNDQKRELKCIKLLYTAKPPRVRKELEAERRRGLSAFLHRSLEPSSYAS